MKKLLKYMILLLLIYGTAPNDCAAQTKNRWSAFRPSNSSRSTKSTRTRYMVKHTGLVYQAGLEVQQGADIKSYGFIQNIGWRFPFMLTVGAGTLPSAQITTFHVDIEGQYYRGRKVDNEYIEGETPNPHHVDFNWTYFALPIYVYANYEFLKTTVSPTAQLRLGGKVKAAGFGGAPYAALHVGCRVALARSSVIPFVGVSLNDYKSEFQRVATTFGVMIGF